MLFMFCTDLLVNPKTSGLLPFFRSSFTILQSSELFPLPACPLNMHPYVASECLKVLQVQLLSIVLFKIRHDFGVGDVGLSDFRSILHFLHDQVRIHEMVYCHIFLPSHTLLHQHAVHGCFILRACESDVRAIAFASRGCLSVCCIPFYQCSM